MQGCVLINFVGHGSESSAMDSYSRQKCIEVGTGNKNLCWIFVCKFLVPGRIWIRNSKIIKLDTDPNYWDSDPHHWRWASRSSAVFQYHNSRTRGMGSEDPCALRTPLAKSNNVYRYVKIRKSNSKINIQKNHSLQELWKTVCTTQKTNIESWPADCLDFHATESLITRIVSFLTFHSVSSDAEETFSLGDWDLNGY